MSKFNKEMLILGREAHGWSQAELARQAQISQGHLSKIETGQLTPKDEHIEVFAKALGFRKRFFTRKDRRRGLPPSYFRKRSSASKRELRQLEAYVNLVKMDVVRMLEHAQLRPQFFVPEIDIDQVDGDVEQVARRLRSSWLIPDGPIANIVDILESAGILLVPVPEEMTPKKFDAMCVPAVDGAPPMIFFNESMPTDRLRFTLAHELGHLILHKFPTDEMEDEANRFASEFLMPKSEIKKHLHGMSLALAMDLKPAWRVSMAALIRRSRDLGCITENQYRYQQMQLSKSGYRRCEPIELSEEEPRRLRQLLCSAAAVTGSDRELARMLDIRGGTIAERYGFSVDDDGACEEDDED